MSKQYHIYGIGAALVDTEITLTDTDLTTMAVAKGVMTLVDEERQNALIDYLQNHLVASHSPGVAVKLAPEFLHLVHPSLCFTHH